jgi:hypothetical protein
MKKRFTIHLIKDGDEWSDYAINEAVLASSATRAKAEEIGSDLGGMWYYGVAIWDHSSVGIEPASEEDRQAITEARRELKRIRARRRAARAGR